MDEAIILPLPMGHWSTAGSPCSFAESKKSNTERTLLLANPPLIEIEISVKGGQVRLGRKLFKKKKKKPRCKEYVVLC